MNETLRKGPQVQRKFERGGQGNLILIWRCLGCGWSREVEAPGYAGTGYEHGNFHCGPLVAVRK